ncbi:hypothetical protein GCM10009678_42440 [Actinomadura kijaniata]|uniref:Uncharacterized protein n=1 Tax=Actinomadura namibiensis TaxID=182080 RepID=A0A7W3LU62_ACTNM|nr:hypothetical protein [Actinomadura namibiensis]MBA8954364.1 hypothetical protein [Actinomadura namibiensis]
MHSRPLRAVTLTLTAGLSLGLTAVPAEAAATHALAVTAVGRDGAAVKPGAYLIDVRTGQGREVPGGRGVRVRAGTYAVTTLIETGEALTLGTRVVKVTRSQTVAFDARKGRQVRFSVDDPTAEVTGLNVLPLVNGDWSVNPISGWSPPNATYVIPTTSKYVSLAAHAVLERRGSGAENPSPYRYDLVRVAKGGIPTTPVYRSKRADLARVDVHVRSFDNGQTGGMDLRAAAPDNRGWLTHMRTELGALPRTVVSYRTPGLRWNPDVTISGPHGNATISDHNDDPTYKKGRFTETWGRAVWGPSRNGVGGSIDGRHLYLTPRSLICQPPRTVNQDCGLSGVTKTARLYRGTTLLAQGKGDLRVKIPTRAAWYTLKVEARRPAGALLSTRVAATLRFKARGYDDGLGHGGVRALTTVYAPRGLDARNHAARGSLTSVPLTVKGHPDSRTTLKSLVVEASADGGRTWRKLAVKREGSHWVVRVRNPNAAGFVSLRATAKDDAGATSVQTITNAYGVR